MRGRGFSVIGSNLKFISELSQILLAVCYNNVIAIAKILGEVYEIIPQKQLKGEKDSTRMNFKELFDTYYTAVYRQLYFLLGEQTAAEDLAQETFLKLYSTPPRDLYNPGGWLVRVATNLAYNYLRSEKSRKERETNVEYERISNIISYDEMFIRSQEVRQVRAVLKQMAVRDRVCLLLKFSGYSYSEIADVIGVEKSSVGTILARALRRFKEEYCREKGDE